MKTQLLSPSSHIHGAWSSGPDSKLGEDVIWKNSSGKTNRRAHRGIRQGDDNGPKTIHRRLPIIKVNNCC